MSRGVKPRVAVVVFPGSNCEQDVVWALRREGADADEVWHGDETLGDAEAVVLPGGFAHGDYLRTGAMARFSPVMTDVRRLADAGGLVLGVCNGFQILAEAGLVPGALMRNVGLRFLCVWTEIDVVDNGTPFTRACSPGQTLRVPINHYEGNYTPGHTTPRVVFRYRDNPNGAWDATAGVANDAGNVLGMMPHPERAIEEVAGSADGRLVFASMIQSMQVAKART